MDFGKLKEQGKKMLNKIKTIKNIEIIIGVVIIAVIALIYSTVTSGDKKNADSGSGGSTATQSGSYGSITDGLESKLAGILANIDGAGKVQVMITFDATAEIVTAATTNTHKNSGSGSTTVTETVSPIIVTNNGKSELIVIKEIMPEIRGVIIVADGADNIKVRLALMRAAEAVLKVNANQIEIFASNK